MSVNGFFQGFMNGVTGNVLGTIVDSAIGTDTLLGTDELVSGVAEPIISSQHAPVGTGEASALNGRIYARYDCDASSHYIGDPASFEHADELRDQAADQQAEGAKQVYDSLVDSATNPTPTGFGSFWEGLQNIFGGSQKYYEANAEMMQAARDQVSVDRGNSPDPMNMEQHIEGTGGCLIA